MVAVLPAADERETQAAEDDDDGGDNEAAAIAASWMSVADIVLATVCRKGIHTRKTTTSERVHVNQRYDHDVNSKHRLATVHNRRDTA